MLAENGELSSDVSLSDALSYSLSFASVGFLLWLFGKYAGILYPGKSMSDRDAPVRGKYHELEMTPSMNEREYSKMSMTALYKTSHGRKQTASISMYSPPHPDQMQPLSQSERVLSVDSNQPDGDREKKRTQSDGANMNGTTAKGIKGRSKGVQRQKISNVTAVEESVDDATFVPTFQKYDDAAKMFSVHDSDYSLED